MGFESNVYFICRQIVSHKDTGYELEGQMSECVDSLLEVKVPRGSVEHVVATDPLTKKCLRALDIDQDDQKQLAKILDADHKGSLNILQIINGLRRLRGTMRRSDTISVELVAQAVQEKVDALQETVHEILKCVDKVSIGTRKQGLPSSGLETTVGSRLS